tara:strand:- start:1083 stop:1469 length:387 start_codon:yes stop_codon:yes gene_type:complete
MRSDIHPEYREVLFHDTSVDLYFVVPSALETDQTKEWEGKTYPYFPLEVSSASHPFYTGKQNLVDTAGRVEKFEKRFGKKTKSSEIEKPEQRDSQETISASEEISEEEIIESSDSNEENLSEEKDSDS